jgi:hypothetical protein
MISLICNGMTPLFAFSRPIDEPEPVRFAGRLRLPAMVWTVSHGRKPMQTKSHGFRMQDQAARVSRCGWPVPDATLAHMRVEAGDEFYSGNFLGIQQLCEFYRARCALGVLVLD